MLSPAQAKEALKEFEVKDGEKRLVDAAMSLSGDSRGAALGLLGYVRTYKTAVQEEHKRLLTLSQEQLGNLSSGARRKVFEAVFPTLAAHVEDAWQMAAKLPYQMFTHNRRAFRAPYHQKHVLTMRRKMLMGLAEVTASYPMDLRWYAQWAPYVAGWRGDFIGVLLAAAIDKRDQLGEDIYQILRETTTSGHPIGVFGRHVTRGLMISSRPEGWELIEKMLVAAQRQEGLRQVILETIDEAHPEAYRRMLHLILDQDIVRFSACIRAVDVWFGFGWTAMDARFAADGLAQLLRFIENPEERADAVRSAPAAKCFMALHAGALEDAVAASKTAAGLLADPDVERRYASVRLLRLLDLIPAQQMLVPLISDPSLYVSVESLAGLPDKDTQTSKTDAFERLERLLPTITQAEATLKPIVWPWNEIKVDRQAIASRLIGLLGERSGSRLLPHLSSMDPHSRQCAVQLLSEAKPLPRDYRDALFALTGDSSSSVRESAFKGLANCTVTPKEAEQIEGLLTRKSGDVRRAALTMLLRQDDVSALATADRLAGSAKTEQRVAAVELIAQLHTAKRSLSDCRDRRDGYRKVFEARGDTAALRSLDSLLSARDIDDAKPITLDDALGLMDPGGLSKPTPPQMPKRLLIFQGQKTALESPAAHAIIQSLNELLDRHAETLVEYETRWGGRQKELLGNINHGLPTPWEGMPEAFEPPLREIWRPWIENRGAALRDSDGFEFHRASCLRIGSQRGYERGRVIHCILEWVTYIQQITGEIDFLIDAFETALAQAPPAELTKPPEPPKNEWTPPTTRWRGAAALVDWHSSANSHFLSFGERWTSEQVRRFWGLLRWYDQPHPSQTRSRPDLKILLRAYEEDAATPDDIYDHLLGPRSPDFGRWRSFNALQQLSGRKLSSEHAKYPWLQPYVDRCRDRIVELEIKRGEIPGPSARAAQDLAYAGGMQTLIRIAIASATGSIDRTGTVYASGSGRSEILSRLLRRTFPGEQDTLEAFTAVAKEARISDKRLVEIAIFAPQWSAHVEEALGWPDCGEAVWWLHAHTKDQGWSIDQETREAWTSEISKRTPLESKDLLDGAVDVEWFKRIQRQLAPQQWKMLDSAAKFASRGSGHKRAQSFADAMLGKLSVEKLSERIVGKRNQDALRCLGLIPLENAADSADEESARRAEILSRYSMIQEFVRGSKKFGSMRQASEKLAAAIAMQNLARTAGYPDPVRLEWAMEREAVADLAGGAVEATFGGVTARLSIDEWGEAQLDAFKDGKLLKTIPAAAKKAPEIARLAERKQQITRQRARMRTSLEGAMCRGDLFHGHEIHDLMQHPVLRPMLRSLVLIEQITDAHATPRIGYAIEDGAGLEDHSDSRSPLPGDCRVRIAHPYDLWKTGQWEKWQWECFSRERLQPFKQVFRELYLLTSAERENGKHSERYSGHQINQKQALAILGKRGWVGSSEEGELARTFHAEGLTASLSFDYGYTTPAEVEGLTVGTISFARRSSYLPIAFDDVSPRVFSEAMRDIDLVVSVAHQGGVDPEASASTVEMRAALLRDACRLLKIENVRLLATHAMVDGKLGKYFVHLGSGVVHRQPGGHLCIVPVHSQHRGRVFLPFADDDPRTAEILSKVVLLARDSEIKDPIILEQIYAGVRQ